MEYWPRLAAWEYWSMEYWSIGVLEYGVWSIENFRRLWRADVRRLAAMITFCFGEARENK